MATIRHKARKKLTDPNVFTEWHRRQLRLGSDFFGWGYGIQPDLRRMKADWKLHRVELIAEHIATWGGLGGASGPGSRPWAWWMWDAPEPRRLLANSINKPVSDELWFGAPRLMTHNAMTNPICESQADFLERHGLFTEREQRYFAKWKQYPHGLTEAQARELWEKGDLTQPATVKKFRRKEKKS